MFKNTKTKILLSISLSTFGLSLANYFEILKPEILLCFVPILAGIIMLENIFSKRAISKTQKQKVYQDLHNLKYDSKSFWSEVIETNMSAVVEGIQIASLVASQNEETETSNTIVNQNTESKNQVVLKNVFEQKLQAPTIYKPAFGLITPVAKSIQVVEEIVFLPKKQFKWNLFKPNWISGLIIIAMTVGAIFSLKVNAVATPLATLNVPSSSRVGENFTFTSGFSNTGTTVGYVPYIDVILPSAGIDGAVSAPFDGIDFISATYLGTALTTTILTFPSSYSGANPCGAGQFPVAHPFAVTATGSPVLVCGKPNEKLVVTKLPFGSFTPGQPQADVTFTVSTSNLADVGTPLNIRSQAGFALGNDSFANPATDPSIISPQVNSNITPSLFDVTKTYNGPENETATGPNFQRSYTISADIANGQTLNGFKLTDVLPNNIIVTGITGSSAPITTTPSTFPFGPVNGGSLVANFTNPVTGTAGTNDANFTFTYYVPEKDANGAPILGVTSGSFNTSTNNANGTGNWTPIDPRDGSSVVVNSVAKPQNQHILNDKSIATQKSVVNKTDNIYSPNDTLEYTLDFQVSDYFSFNNLIQTDTFSDGQRFDPSFTPTLTVTDRNGTVTGNFSVGTNAIIDTSKIGNTAKNIDPSTDGTTTITFNISQAMTALGGADGTLQGGRSILPNATGATGRIVFQTKIQDKYSDDYNSTANDSAVSLNDVLTNNTTIRGNVLNNTTLAPTGSTQSDNSGTTISIAGGSLTKVIYAINGNTNFGANPTITAGDNLTYRIQYSVPQSDTQMLRLADYLPLPVFPVGPVSTVVDPTVSAAVPPVNTVKFGPNHTFHPTGLITPILAKDMLSNSLWMDFGTRSDPLNRPSNIDILLSVKASPDPIGDGVLITNQVRSIIGSTNTLEASADAIIPVNYTEPRLKITKGIIGEDNPAASFTPATTGPVAFTQPPATTCPRFSGTINSTNLTTSPINSNLSNSDAGDIVRYAIAIENTGDGVNGAFDVNIRDQLPVDMINPSNICVTLGDGTVLTAGTGYTNVGTGLFDPTGGIKLVDPTAIKGSLTKKDPSTGKNIVIVSYDAVIGANVQPNQNLINTARITNYAAQPNGPDFTTVDPADTAQTVNVAPPKITKTIVATNQAHTTGNDTVIGEKITYKLSVVVPEGKVSGLKITDTLDDGLVFVKCNSITNINSTDVVTSLGANFNSACSDPTNPAITNSGKTSTFTLGNVINSNRNNAVDEVIEILYDVVVDNVPANINGQTRKNNAVLTWIDPSKTDQSANAISSSAPDVTIKEPKLGVTKSATPNTGDAGDTITYTIVLTHTGTTTADAFNVNLADILPAGLTYLGGLTSTGFTPTTLTPSGGNVNATFDTFPIGSTTTITFQATVNSTVNPSQIINNAVNVDWTSLPGVVNTALSNYGTTTVERTGKPADIGGTANNYNTNSNVNFTVDNFQPIKTLVSTSEPLTTGNNMTIGEIARYRLTIAIPEGTSTGLKMVDNLPSGMTYLNDGTTKIGTSANLASNLTNTIGVTGACNTIGTNPNAIPTCTLAPAQISLSGNSPVFTLGNWVNNENDADKEYIIVEFNAVVNNDTTNQAFNNTTGATTATTLTNTFGSFINGTTLIGTSNGVAMTVVEPVIRNLTKVLTKTPTDAGDEAEYTLTFSNTGNAPAFNVAIGDILDTNLVLNNPTTTGIVITKPTATTVINTSTASNVNLILNQLLPTETVTIVIKTNVKANAPAGSVINNVANLTYTSLPDDNGTIGNPTGSNNTGAIGTSTGERTGGTGVNDYNSTANVSATLSTPTVDKKTPTKTTWTIGDLVDYDILVTLPEGTTKSLVIRDNLPLGLSYVSNQVITTGSGLANPYSGTPATPAVSTVGSTVNFTFSDTLTGATTATTANSFILRVKTKVNNIFSNQRTTTLTNTADLQYLSGNGSTLTVNDPTSASITLVEPILDLTKAISNAPTPLDAGDNIEYTITLKHNTNSGATAYDTKWTDVLPATLGTPNCVSITVTGTTTPALTCSDFSNSGQTLQLTSFDLPLGAQVVLKYTAKIANTTGYNQSITNAASVNWSTQPGSNPDERKSGDGILDTLNAVNDYLVNTSTTTTTNGGANIAKALVSTDAVNTTGNNLTIGENATYELSVSLSEGQVNNLVVTDIIPAGMQYVAGSVAIDTTGYNGVLPTPTVSGGIASGSPVSFTFATALTNGDNIDTNNTFKIRLQVKVLDIPSNTGATPATKLDNVANLSIDGGAVIPSKPVTVVVVEPKLTLAKDIVQTTANVNDIIDINLSIVNTGTSEAFDVVLDDPLLVANFANIVNSTVNMGNFSFSLVPSGANTIVRFSGGSIPVGATQIFSFKAKIISANYAQTLNNVATITQYSTLNGVISGERTEPIVVANDNITTTAPDLTITKDDGEKTVVPGQILIYGIEVSNIGDGVSTGVVITETVPAGTTFDLASSTPGWSCADGSPAGTICTFTISGIKPKGIEGVKFGVKVNDTIATGVNTIINTATVKDDGTHGPEIRNDNNTATDTDELTASPILSLTKDDYKTAVAPGDTITYDLVIANDGNQDASGVILTDTLPNELTFLSASNGGTLTGNVVTWPTIANIPAGLNVVRKVTVQVKNPYPVNTNVHTNNASVTDNGLNTDGVPVTATASNTDTVTASPILTLVKTDNDITTYPTGSVVYTLKLSNTGNQLATGVLVSETVPVNTTFEASGSTIGWSCANGAVAGSICTYTVGNMIGQSTQNVFFAIKVIAGINPTVSQLNNTATIKDDKNNTGTGSDNTPVKYVDMSVVKDDGGITTQPNKSIPYTITYTNKGGSIATGVIINETVPVNTTFDIANSTTGWSCANGAVAGTICSINIGTVVPAGTGTTIFSVKVNSGVATGTTISNTATITDDGSHGLDTDTTNNTGSDTTPIVTTATITGQVYLDPNNSGTQDGSEPNGSIPAGTLVQITNTANPTITFTVTLNSDGTYSQVVPAGTYSVVVIPAPSWTLSISTQTGDGIGANPTIVTALPTETKSAGKDGLYQSNSGMDLAITKTDNGITTAPGGIIVYELKFNNIGGVNATGVKINEIVPANTTFDASNSTTGWTCPLGGISGSPCTFNIGNLNAGIGGSVFFAVKVKPTTPNGYIVKNTAGIADDGTHGADNNQGNNNSPETTPVVANSSSTNSSNLSSGVSSGVSSNNSSTISSGISSTNNSAVSSGVSSGTNVSSGISSNNNSSNVSSSNLSSNNSSNLSSGVSSNNSSTISSGISSGTNVSSNQSSGVSSTNNSAVSSGVSSNNNSSTLSSGVSSTNNSAVSSGVSSNNNSSNISSGTNVSSATTTRITGQVYLDPNNSGTQDGSEPNGSIPLGTVVQITDLFNPGSVIIAILNSDGTYSANVPAGTYAVVVIAPSGYSVSISTELGDGTGANPTIVSVASGETKPAGKDGLYKPNGSSSTTISSNVSSTISSTISSGTNVSSNLSSIASSNNNSSQVSSQVNSSDASSTASQNSNSTASSNLSSGVSSSNVSSANSVANSSVAVSNNSTNPSSTITNSSVANSVISNVSAVSTNSVNNNSTGSQTSQTSVVNNSTTVSTISFNTNSTNSSSRNSSTNSSSNFSQASGVAVITGHIYLDANQNNTLDSNEPNGNIPAGTIVQISNVNNPSIVFVVVLNSDGTYSQTVPVGTYSVVVIAPSGWVVNQSTQLGNGTGTNPTVVTVANNETKSAGKDGLYQPTPASSANSSMVSSTVSSTNNSTTSIGNSSGVSSETNVSSGNSISSTSRTTKSAVNENSSQVSANSSSTNNSSNNSSLIAKLDIEILKTPNAAVITPNSTLIYTLKYGNIGNVDSTGTIITELIPAYTTFNAGASDPRWNCVANSAGNICTLNLGNLPIGQVGTVLFGVTVDSIIPAGTEILNYVGIGDDGSHGADINTDNNTSNTSTPVIPTANAATIIGQVYLDPNQSGIQENGEPSGSIPAGTTVKLTDTTDPTKFYIVPLNPDGTYSQVVSAGTYSVLVIAPTGYIITNSLENGSGSGSNATTITAVAGETKNAGKDGLYLVPPTYYSDLEVKKTILQRATKKFDYIIYSFKFRNLGVDTATNVRLIDQMPTSLEYISATYEGNPITPTISGQNLTFTIPTLLVGVQKEILITAKVLSEGNITNIVDIVSNESDPDVSNNRDTVTITIPPVVVIPVIPVSSATSSATSSIKPTSTTTTNPTSTINVLTLSSSNNSSNNSNNSSSANSNQSNNSNNSSNNNSPTPSSDQSNSGKSILDSILKDLDNNSKGNPKDDVYGDGKSANRNKGNNKGITTRTGGADNILNTKEFREPSLTANLSIIIILMIAITLTKVYNSNKE